MAVVAHWRMIVEPEEAVDNLYHVLYSGAFAPRTACGIHRGGKIWHEEEAPPVEVQCEVCVENRIPDS